MILQAFKTNNCKLPNKAECELIKIRIFSTLATSMINEFQQKPHQEGLYKAMIKSINERQIRERIKLLMQHQIQNSKPLSIAKSVQRPESSQSNQLNPIQTPSQHETSISFLNHIIGETGKMNSDQKNENFNNLLQTSQDDCQQFFNSHPQRHESIERFNTAHFKDSVQQSKQLVRNAKYMMAMAQHQQRKKQQSDISERDGKLDGKEISSCQTSYNKQNSQGSKSIKIIPIRASDGYGEDDEDNDMRVLTTGINYQQDSELNMYPSTIIQEITRQDAFTSGCRTNGYGTKQLYQTKKSDMAVVDENNTQQQEEEQKINDDQLTATNRQQILITQTVTPEAELKQISYHHLRRPSSQLQLALSPDHDRCLQNLGKLPTGQQTKSTSSVSIPLSHRRNESSNSSYLLSNTANINMMNQNINSNASSSCYFLPPVGSSQASSLYSSIVSSNYQTLRQDNNLELQQSNNKVKDKKPQLVFLNAADGTPAFGKKCKSVLPQLNNNKDQSARTNILASGRYDSVEQQIQGDNGSQMNKAKSHPRLLVLQQCQKIPIQKIGMGVLSTSSSSSAFNPSQIASNKHKNHAVVNGRNTNLDLTQLSSISNAGSSTTLLQNQNILSTSSRGGGGNSNKNINSKTLIVPNTARASSMSLDYSINSAGGIKKYGGNLLRKDLRNNRSTANIKVTDMSHWSSFSCGRGTTAINSSRSTTRQNSCDQVIRYSVIDELDKAKKRFGGVSASFSLDEGNRSMWAKPRSNITASQKKDTKKRGVINENSVERQDMLRRKQTIGGGAKLAAQKIIELSTKMAEDASENLQEIKPVQSIFGKIRDQNIQSRHHSISSRAQRINSIQDQKQNENKKVKIMKTDIKFQSKGQGKMHKRAIEKEN